MKLLRRAETRTYSFSPINLRDKYIEHTRVIDSIAFSVVICFVLRIGDRHTSNIV